MILAADGSAGGAVAGGIVFLIAAGLYLLPTVIAWARHHHNLAMIAVLNVFLGWTLIGWVIFLAMAFSNPAPTTR